MSEVTGCRSEPGAPSTCLASRGPESRFSHGPGYDHHHLWGAITLVISPAHLPLTVSLGSLGNDPWDSSPVPPEYPLCSTAPQECLSRDPRRGPPPQNTPRPPREPLAQPLTSLALALSVACPIPAGWGSWCHGGRWDEAPEIKPHSGSDSHGPRCHHWLLRGGLWGGWGLVT